MPQGSQVKLTTLAIDLSPENLHLVLEDESLKAFIRDYQEYRDSVRQVVLGKTAQFWLSYMDKIWLVLALLQSVKANDFPLYARCLFLMPDLFFSFGGQNYARYLSFFSIFIANVEETHPRSTALLERGAISAARSFIPGNRSAVDKTIEETFMKHAKSHGGAGGSGAGLSGILSNYNAYQRWVRTMHERSQYVNVTLNMADMLSGSEGGRQHHDVRPSEIQKSEQNVLRTVEAFKSFLDPFSVEDNDRLYNISSGAPVPTSIETDVMRAEVAGKKAKEAFIRDRLEKKEKFFEPVKRMNLKVMSDMNKTIRVKTAKNKVVEYKQQGNIAFQLLVWSQSQDRRIDMKELMAFPLTPIPYSIGTADGFLAKTDKAKGYHHLTKDIEDAVVLQGERTLVIEDGNASFYYMKELPDNFNQISHKVFDIMSKNPDVIFSTDMYKDDSVKAMERKRRGCAEKLIIKGENTKKPADWKEFLTNDQNKKQFIEILLTVWSSDRFADKLKGRSVTLICEGRAYCLSSEDGKTTLKTEIRSLASTQEETDSRVVLYCIYGKENGYKVVRVKSPDSDIFSILLHYAYATEITIHFETGAGNKRRLIDMTELAHRYTQQHCTALMALHAFTGCDSTSAFKGIGKIKPIKTLQKMPKFELVLAQLGDSWEVSDDLFTGLEEFTCAVYGKPRFSEVDDLRYSILKGKCNEDGRLDPANNIDIGTLPPCRKSLRQHIKRANYQTCIWKRAHVSDPIIPTPTEGHGWVLIDSKMEPLWTEEDILPQELADILEEAMQSDDDSEPEDPEFVESDDSSESN